MGTTEALPVTQDIVIQETDRLRLERLQTLLAYANSQVATAGERLNEVNDEIEWVMADSKRRLKALEAERTKLDQKVKNEQATSAQMYREFQNAFFQALKAVGVEEGKLKDFKVETDSHLNIVRVYDATNPEK